MAPPPPQLRLRLQYDLDGAVVGFLDTALLNAVYRRRVRAQRLGMGSAIAVGVAALGIQLTRAPWPEVFFSVYGFGLFVVCTLVVSFVAIGVGIQRKAVRFLRFDLRGFRLQGVGGDGALREWTDVTEIARSSCTTATESSA